jgi:L1 cell adhesion molecule like protein
MSTGAKRMIGRRFDDVLPDDIKRWPFKVISQMHQPIVEVSFRRKIEHFTPEQISAAVLSKMKQTAEEYLNDDVTDAVITVPAYFSDSQRQATKDAAEIAGLNVLRLINEPTAAAIAYGLKAKISNDQNILVFDMGGGTFDVSILALDDELYQVKAVGGDTHLGGEDFNNKMLDHFLKEIAQKYGKDLSDDKHAISELLGQCELAKIALSTKTVADVTVKALQNGFDFKSTMTRACFEELNADFFKKAIDIVEKTIKDAKLTKAEIHEVVLVGGSTYIPKVQQMLQKCFNGKALNKSIKPDEAVAYGAAVMAANLGNASDDEFDLVLLDVIPHSLGIETLGNLFSKIVEKNSPIPISKTEDFFTARDLQTDADIRIYEGEDPVASKNNLLGKFVLKGIPIAPAGHEKLKVTLKIDENGILKATAVSVSNGAENSIVIEEYKDRMDRDEIEKKKREEKVLKVSMY